jgi:hypothetical protein
MWSAMKHDLPTDEDLGAIASHRATVPALLWGAALAVACVMSWFDAAPAVADASSSAAPIEVVQTSDAR